jgi:hypothetical protein
MGRLVGFSATLPAGDSSGDGCGIRLGWGAHLRRNQVMFPYVLDRGVLEGGVLGTQVTGVCRQYICPHFL